MIRTTASLAVAAFLTVSSAAWADDLTAGMTKGSADVKTAGPLAFAPEGILLIGDAAGAAVFAIATEDTKGNPESVSLNVPAIDEKVAAKHAKQFPKINLVTIADFGGWEKAQKKHFNDRGVFDQIYAPE